MVSFKKGDRVERPHPHRPEEKVVLTITEVREGHSFAESDQGDPFVIFHESFEPEQER